MWRNFDLLMIFAGLVAGYLIGFWMGMAHMCKQIGNMVAETADELNKANEQQSTQG